MGRELKKTVRKEIIKESFFVTGLRFIDISLMDSRSQLSVHFYNLNTAKKSMSYNLHPNFLTINPIIFFLHYKQ